MTLLIGENIKRLRQEKGITQEKLAEHLNISCPAISKWERGETYPDIAMIIPIAAYFGVSTDELLGFGKAEAELRVQALIDDYRAVLVTGRWSDAQEIITRAHAEFPENIEIIHWYTQHIIGGNADNPRELVLEKADELLELCEYVLERSNKTEYRNGAIDIMAKVYVAQGNVERAYEVTEAFADWYGTRGQKREQLFGKCTPEWWRWINCNFANISDFAVNKALKLIWYSDKSMDEKLAGSLKIADMLMSALEYWNYEPLYRHLMCVYSMIATNLAGAGDFKRACDYFDLNLQYDIKLDEFVASDRQIPNTDASLKAEMYADWLPAGTNFAMNTLSWLEGTPFLSGLRETDEYKYLITKYRNYK